MEYVSEDSAQRDVLTSASVGEGLPSPSPVAPPPSPSQAAADADGQSSLDPPLQLSTGSSGTENDHESSGSGLMPLVLDTPPPSPLQLNRSKELQWGAIVEILEALPPDFNRVACQPAVTPSPSPVTPPPSPVAPPPSPSQPAAAAADGQSSPDPPLQLSPGSPGTENDHAAFGSGNEGLMPLVLDTPPPSPSQLNRSKELQWGAIVEILEALPPDFNRVACQPAVTPPPSPPVTPAAAAADGQSSPDSPLQLSPGSPSTENDHAALGSGNEALMPLVLDTPPPSPLQLNRSKELQWGAIVEILEALPPDFNRVAMGQLSHLLAVKAPVSVETLENLFGVPIAAQIAPVTPPANNGTLLDLDYWDSADDYSPATADYDKFDWTLTKRVSALSNENFLLSPLGLKLALAILTEAATGNTQSELSNVLGFDLDRAVVRRKFATIIASLQTKSSQFILNLGSRIYVDDYVEPRQRFAAIAQEFYKTDLTKIDFNKATVAAKEINSWVANATDGHIMDLVNEDDIKSAIVLVLNTIYFKGTWRHQFVPNATKPGTFYVTPTSQKQVSYMNVKEKFYFSNSMKYDAKILRMPYLGNKFSMYVIVPNSLSGLPRVLSGLNELRAELNYLQERLVDVTLPKFTFDYTSVLDGILKELGVRQAFEDTASFPGIARGQSLQQRLRISKVLQRSGIEVNELGSVAYSATEISLVNKFGEEDDVSQEVVANKPFLFFIQDEATRQLLFTGRVSDPALKDGAFKLP